MYLIVCFFSPDPTPSLLPIVSTHTHTHTAPCGGVFDSKQGEIISPNWPSDYNARSVCTWRISIPTATSVQVAFTHFELQTLNLLGNCEDYVEIFNGETMESQGWQLHYILSCVPFVCLCFHTNENFRWRQFVFRLAVHPSIPFSRS